MENKLMTYVENEEQAVSYAQQKDYIAIWNGGGETVLGRDFTNYPIDSKNMASYLKLITKTPTKIADVVNTVIEVQYVYLENVEINDEKEPSGKRIAPRMLLISPKGEVYSSVATTAFNSFMRIFRHMKEGDIVKVKVTSGKNGANVFFNFEVVD